MKACVTLPWSSAKAGLWRYRRLHWKLIDRHYASRTVPRSPASPIIPESDASREHPSFHVDKDNKTVTTAIGDLPLSPIMDPDYWDATMRLHAPKAKEGKAQNSLERQFRKSAFANALGTPIRQCTASKIRLPSFFLQDFNLIAHPKTNQPWWVPRSFAREQPAGSQQADTPASTPEIPTDLAFRDEQASPETDQEGPGTEEPGTEEPPTEEPPTGEPPPETETTSTVQTEHKSPYGPSAYLFARQELIASFTQPGSSYQNHNRYLFGGSSSRFVRLAAGAVWRKDMDVFILDLMRNDITDDILYLSRLCVEDTRHYIVKCHGWEDIKYKRDGAVLWFGETAGSEDAEESEAQPGPFAVYDTSNDGKPTSVAVHNMSMLLGAETAAKLKREAGVLVDGSLFMLTGRRTVDLQLRLWKLQGYMADFRELP
ncbi:hypothetical protein F4861DRAFT_500912 [Xylaria intraflava]|nr:hypothetical protein F4861DRAFT_500912 [Xylaria intraflava]